MKYDRYKKQSSWNMDAKVKKLLKNHPNLSVIESDDGKCKVVCQFTSHEMPCTLTAIQSYVNGKKYRNLCKDKLTSEENELCSEYLIEKGNRGQLYCKLTKRYINNLPHHIRKHLNGRRFQKMIVQSKSADASDQERSEQLHKPELSCKDVEMWVPSDLESESAESEGLDEEFTKEKPKESSDKEDSYSFDVLDKDEQMNEKEAQTPEKNLTNKAKKRSAQHFDKPVKKAKRLENQKTSNETPKKKKRT